MLASWIKFLDSVARLRIDRDLAVLVNCAYLRKPSALPIGVNGKFKRNCQLLNVAQVRDCCLPNELTTLIRRVFVKRTQPRLLSRRLPRLPWKKRACPQIISGNLHFEGTRSHTKDRKKARNARYARNKNYGDSLSYRARKRKRSIMLQSENYWKAVKLLSRALLSEYQISICDGGHGQKVSSRLYTGP